ncbi:MAG: MurR/RpiR family transcriptional regulator, partial [Rhizobiaceae bacterium]
AARFALSHPDDFALGTAASIADRAGVQPSTLVRLARHFGYGGFSDLQDVFRDRLRTRASSYEERLRTIEAGAMGQSYEGALLNGFLAAARRSVDALSSTLDEGNFSRCVNALAEAETLYLLARRRSYPLVAHMGYAFASLGIRAVTLATVNGIDAEIARLATPRDAAIACSFSPYARETLDLAGTLASNGVAVVGITDSPLSPLASLATHWLEVAEHDFAGFRSLSAGMALATALAVAIAERRRLKGRLAASS